MRTEAETEQRIIKLPTSVMYQFDDYGDITQPHHYQWRGVTASGETKSDALQNLGLKIANSMNMRIS